MTFITAHSGCDHTTDNSIEFLEYALSREVDNIEIDVQKNENGILVLSHDKADRSAPLLETAFSMLKAYPDKKINCDLKQENLEFEVYYLAQKTGVADRLIYSGTVNLSLIKRAHSQLPNIDIYLNIERLFPQVYQFRPQGNTENHYKKLYQAALEVSGFEFTCINVEYHMCTVTFLAFLKQNKIPCSAWTVNDESNIKHLLEQDLYNITTRNAGRALKIREEFMQ